MDTDCEFAKKFLLFVRITHERPSLFNDAHPSSFETNIELRTCNLTVTPRSKRLQVIHSIYFARGIEN